MSRTAQPTPKQRMVTHRDLARLLGVSTSVIRLWVQRGEFPEPTAIVAQTWLYNLRAVESFINTGRWPAGTRFRRGVGAGRVEPDEMED
jgi:hypothetical protein